MRLAAGLVLGSGCLALLSFGTAPARAEYYCSPGFEPSHRGRCIAVAARDQIDLYLNDPSLAYAEPHRRRRGLSARY